MKKSYSELQVPDLSRCLKMKKLGFPQDPPGYYWVEVPKNKEFVEWQVLSGDHFLKFFNSGLLLEERNEGYVWRYLVGEVYWLIPLIKAPTPIEIEQHFKLEKSDCIWFVKVDDKWIAYYLKRNDENWRYPHEIKSDTLPNAFADLWIWRREVENETNS